MKLIGIIGKSGAGKTTFVNILQRIDENISVIHLDEITDIKSIKKKLPKNMTKTFTNSIGEEKIILNNKQQNFLDGIKRSKFINSLYNKLRTIPNIIELNKYINRYKKSESSCIIIERLYIR